MQLCADLMRASAKICEQDRCKGTQPGRRTEIFSAYRCEVHTEALRIYVSTDEGSRCNSNGPKGPSAKLGDAEDSD
eukprot:1292367-Amphidinium_carterae.2